MWETAGTGTLTISELNTLANNKYGIVTSVMLCSVPAYSEVTGGDSKFPQLSYTYPVDGNCGIDNIG